MVDSQPRDRPDEIEVTAEMLEAGASVPRWRRSPQGDCWDAMGPDDLNPLLTEIYRAMHLARRA